MSVLGGKNSREKKGEEGRKEESLRDMKRLFVWLLIGLFVWLLIGLFVWLLIWLFVWLLIRLQNNLFFCLFPASS